MKDESESRPSAALVWLILPPSSFILQELGASAADPPTREFEMPTNQHLEDFPRNFRLLMKMQQTGKEIFFNSPRSVMIGLVSGCVTRGTRAGEWKILRSLRFEAPNLFL